MLVSETRPKDAIEQGWHITEKAARSAGQPVPIDLFTGLPLPINVLPGELPERGIGGLPTRTDLHHLWFDARTFSDGEGRSTEREVWTQNIPRWAHVWYHELAHPLQPDDNSARRVARLVLIAAGYVPHETVVLPERGGELLREPLLPSRISALRQRGLHNDNPGKLKAELLRWVITQGLTASRGEVEDFVHAKDTVIRAVDGLFILKPACHEATRPLRELYHKAHRRGRLPLSQPADVGDCIYNLLALNERGEPNMAVISWLGKLLGRQELQVA